MKFIFCLILIFFVSLLSSAAKETLLKVEKDRVTLSNSHLLQYTHLNNQDDYTLHKINELNYFKSHDIQTIKNKNALNTSAFDKLSGLELLTNDYTGHVAFELELFIQEDSDIEDVLFLYASSSLSERDTPLVLDLKSLKRNQWIKFQIWMPDFIPSKGTFVDLQITNPCKLRYMDLDSPLKGGSRSILNTYKTLSQYKGVFLHSISIVKSNLSTLTSDDVATIKNAVLLKPSHFDHPISLSLLTLFVIVFLLHLILKFQTKIGAKILVGFLIPIVLATLFLGIQGINDLMSSIEASQLYKIQTNLKNEAIKLNQTKIQLDQNFINTVQKNVILKLKKLIDSCNSLGLSLEENPFAKAKSVALQNRLSIENESFLPKHPQFTSQNTVDLILNTQVEEHDLSIMLTNGSTIFFSDNQFVGKTLKHVSTMFHKHLYNEIQDSRHKNNSQVQMKLIEEIMTQHLTKSSVFGKFINQPSRPTRFQKEQVESNKSLSKIFWTHFIHEDKLWVIFGGIRKAGILKNIKREVSKVLTSTDSYSDEYLFFGSNLINSFFSKDSLNNEMLEIASLAKKQRTLRFVPILQNKTLTFYTYNVYNPNDEFSFVLKKSGTDCLKNVQESKNYLYYGIYILILLIYACSSILSHVVIQPFLQLSKSMRNIATSHIGQDLKSQSKDQFAEVASLLNYVIQSLREKQYISKFLSNMVKSSIDQSINISTRQNQYILFCGIQNLKELESSLDYKQLAQLIDSFLKQVQAVITTHQGRIDKFTGKSSLSIYSADLDPEQICSLLQTLHHTLTKLSTFETTNRSVKFGVGLAYGPVVLGHVGSNTRKDYTAIGSTVNKAARLEALASKTVNTVNIYFDKNTLDQLLNTSIQFKSCQALSLKGYEKKQEVYELL